MPHLFNPVDYAIPAFIILIVAEMLWARSRAPEKYEPRETLTSLALGTGSTVAGALTGALLGRSLALWRLSRTAQPPRMHAPAQNAGT